MYELPAWLLWFLELWLWEGEIYWLCCLCWSLCCRVFYGMTTEDTILREISLFWELLGSTDTVLRETYIVADYENPSIRQCRNEIWFIC